MFLEVKQLTDGRRVLVNTDRITTITDSVTPGKCSYISTTDGESLTVKDPLDEIWKRLEE